MQKEAPTQQQPDPVADSVWMRPPRKRRGRPQLSREEIVTAAVELLDAEGLDGFSMRRLAAGLSAGATSAYFYVANKDELLELAVDEIMAEITFLDPDEAGWRAAAAGLAQGMRTLILRHTWMIGLLGKYPTIGPNAMRMSDQMIRLLTVAGFSGMPLAWASGVLMCHSIGAATSEAAMHTATAGAGGSPEDLLAQFSPMVERAADDYPHYAAWWREADMSDLDQDAGFTFGLERVLDGLEAWLNANPPAEGRSPQASRNTE